MINLKNISKVYGDHIILNNCNYQFPASGMFCIIGDNGAGKTTLLNIIANIVMPTSGNVTIDGIEISKNNKVILSYISYVPDSCPIYPFITGKEFLSLIRSIRRPSQDLVESLIHQFGLKPHINTKFDQMSLGTKKKFMLISTLMTDAKIWIFDEPINGLDDLSQNLLKKVLIEESKKRLIIMTCHDSKTRSEISTIDLNIDTFK